MSEGNYLDLVTEHERLVRKHEQLVGDAMSRALDKQMLEDLESIRPPVTPKLLIDFKNHPMHQEHPQRKPEDPRRTQ